MTFPPRTRHSWRDYGVALAAVAVAAAARWAFSSVIGPTALPFIFFFPAVAAAAWYGGLGPGIVAVALAVLLAQRLYSADVAALIAFAVASAFIVGAMEAMHRTARRRSQDIGERSRVQEELAEARDLLQTTLSSIGDGVIVTDHSGCITFLNPQAESLTGWRLNDCRGRPLVEVFKIVNELTRAIVDDPVAKVLRLGTVVGLANHTILITKSGAETPIDDSAAPIHRPDGSLAGVVLVFRGVAAERQAQIAQARLAAIIEFAGDAIVSKDLNGTILSWNRAAERIFGYTSDEIVGRSITELIPLERRDEEDRILDRIRHGQPFERFETIRLTKDGRRIPLSINVSPVKNQDGEVIGASKTAHEISDVVAAREALAREKELLATTLASIGDAVIVTDATGRITFMNGTAERLTGWSQKEAQGHELPAVFRIVNEQTRATVENPVEKVLRLGQVVGLANHTTLIARNGAQVPIDDSAAPIRLHGGIEGVVLVFRDITQRRLAEEALQLADRRKDEFLAILSHELRNPLAPIALAVSMLRRSGLPQSELDQLRDIIDRQAGQLKHLLDDLLDVSRIRLGKISLHKARLSLAVAVESAVETVLPLIEARRHELTVVMPDAPIDVQGDLARLAQVLTNLLNNAAKYTEKGGRISVTIAREGNDGVVRIADNGIGIERHQLSEIFEIFAQVDRSLEGGQGGLGVGLALARTLVELHGGTLTADSEGLGRGSEFVVRLPALSAAHTAPDALTDGTQAAVATKPSRILVADDNVDSVYVVAETLRQLGHEVATAYDGLAAVETAGAFEPDVAILDIGMPKLNGYDAAARIREDAARRGKRVSLIAMTGWGQEKDKESAFDAGFDRHLTKPVDFQVLRRLVADLTERT